MSLDRFRRVELEFVGGPLDGLSHHWFSDRHFSEALWAPGQGTYRLCLVHEAGDPADQERYRFQWYQGETP